MDSLIITNSRRAAVSGETGLGSVETATVTDADIIVMGVAPRTRIDEAVFARRCAECCGATSPVLVVPVVAGAHEWIDEVTEEDAFTTPSTADAMA
jgi:hypothetical protein